jgi:hypothetical protein
MYKSKRYVILKKDENGRVLGWTSNSKSFVGTAGHFSKSNARVLTGFYADKRYLSEILRDIKKVEPNAFIARLHSKKCPVKIGYKELKNKLFSANENKTKVKKSSYFVKNNIKNRGELSDWYTEMNLPFFQK